MGITRDQEVLLGVLEDQLMLPLSVVSPKSVVVGEEALGSSMKTV